VGEHRRQFITTQRMTRETRPVEVESRAMRVQPAAARSIRREYAPIAVR